MALFYYILYTGIHLLHNLKPWDAGAFLFTIFTPAIYLIQTSIWPSPVFTGLSFLAIIPICPLYSHFDPIKFQKGRFFVTFEQKIALLVQSFFPLMFV